MSIPIILMQAEQIFTQPSNASSGAGRLINTVKLAGIPNVSSYAYDPL